MTEASRGLRSGARFQGPPDRGSIILRDGTVADLRPARSDDSAGLAGFFSGLSEESRRRRFLSTAPPDRTLIEFLCRTDPSNVMTLVVTRQVDGHDRIVACGSYASRGDGSAEVSMAVEDPVQGLGLGTHLLEHLAAVASESGFKRFWALTGGENREMIDLFRQSGYLAFERRDGSAIEVGLDIVPNATNLQKSEMRELESTVASLRPFLEPAAVAIVGASRDPASVGYRILDEMLRGGFQGRIYPVNARASEVLGLACSRSVKDLPDGLDLAVIAVPRDAVPSVVDECAARGVRALVIVTAGFAECGGEGKKLQDELIHKVRGYGMRMIGPNCMGLLNAAPSIRLNASFSPVFPKPGGLAMSSQSGALGLAVLELAAERHLGFSSFVSVGNKADVSGNDLLQYWEQDARTSVILLYLESFGNPRRFARIARRVGRKKPIVAVKAGRSRAGGRAAGSHTAALAANDVAVDALFRQAGIIRADTVDELFDIGAALDSQPLPRGKRVAIITNAGGPGILCADACEAGGLSVVELPPDTQKALRALLPGAAAVANPIDMVASAGPESYRQTIHAVLSSSGVDALIVIYIPVDRDDPHRISEAILEGVESGRASGGGGKPVLACLMSGAMRREPLRTADESLPVYAFPESAAKTLSKCAEYSAWKNEPAGAEKSFDDIDTEAARRIVSAALARKDSGWLTPGESQRIFRAFGIRQPEGVLARSATEAAAAAEGVGFPVAVKLVSSSILHKSDSGGVILNVENVEDAKAAYTRIESEYGEAMEGAWIQGMVKGGVELMVGITADPLFGPLIAFGIGGTHVEIFKDVVFRIAPLTDVDSRAMVRGIRGFPLLMGYRGHPPADVDAVEESLLRLSQMAREIPEIVELDMNPLIAMPPGHGAIAVDVRIRVARDPN